MRVLLTVTMDEQGICNTHLTTGTIAEAISVMWSLGHLVTAISDGIHSELFGEPITPMEPLL